MATLKIGPNASGSIVSILAEPATDLLWNPEHPLEAHFTGHPTFASSYNATSLVTDHGTDLVFDVAAAILGVLAQKIQASHRRAEEAAREFERCQRGGLINRQDVLSRELNKRKCYTITTLTIESNEIAKSYGSVADLARAISACGCIKTICLDSVSMPLEGFKLFCRALRFSSTLRKLNLEQFEFPKNGFQLLLGALSRQKKMKELHVKSAIKVTDDDQQYLKKFFFYNATLSEFKIDCTSMTMGAANSIVNSLSANPWLEALGVNVSDDKARVGGCLASILRYNKHVKAILVPPIGASFAPGPEFQPSTRDDGCIEYSKGLAELNSEDPSKLSEILLEIQRDPSKGAKIVEDLSERPDSNFRVNVDAVPSVISPAAKGVLARINEMHVTNIPAKSLNALVSRCEGLRELSISNF